MHERIGKIIVASRDEEIPVLERLEAQAVANGVTDLTWLDRAQIATLEPRVSAVRGLLSPSTGIVDSHEFMSALRRDAESAGATVVASTPVLAGRVVERGIELAIGGPDAATALCRTVVNTRRSARSRRGALDPRAMPTARASPPSISPKGTTSCWRVRRPSIGSCIRCPFRAGSAFTSRWTSPSRRPSGPVTVSWQDGVDYAFDEQRAAAFYDANPALFSRRSHQGSLLPGYTGIRPKLGPAAAPAQDASSCRGPAAHGVQGLLNLYGIESPGLTASLALAEHGARRAPVAPAELSRAQRGPPRRRGLQKAQRLRVDSGLQPFAKSGQKR